MKKNISVTGSERTVEGYVRIVLNARKEKKNVHNHSTHEEEEREFVYHTIQAVADGYVIKRIETQNESQILSLARDIESLLYLNLKTAADRKQIKSITDQLKDMGYSD